MKVHNLLTRLLVWFFVFWMALPVNLSFAQVYLDPPIITGTNTLRLVVNGPTTNIRYDVYFTNALSSNATSWPLLITGGTNQVIFDLTMPDPDGGFFLVTSNYVATTNPPPQVATPEFDPSSGSGNAPVAVTVTCDTPGAVIYYTTDGSTPTTSDNYIASGGTLVISCATTLKARAFRADFVDSEVATGTYSVNCPPMVFAGSQQVTSGSQVTLQGVVTDDGQAMAISNYWRQISGPAAVSFGNVNATNSTVTMSVNGIYVLQLEAFDGYWTTTDLVTVARNPAISVAVTAPAGSSTFNVPTNIALEASATTTSGSITQVQFYAGSELIGTDTSAPWTYEWRNVPAGNHDLYAVATANNTNHFSLASSPVSITVNFPTDIGRFTLASADLTIPVAGLPITINRSHDSRYGGGWSFGQNMRLDYEAVNITKSASLGSGYTALRDFGQDCIVPEHETLVIVALSPTELYYFRPRIVFQLSGDPPCVGSSSLTHLTEIRHVFDPVGPLGGQLASIDAPEGVGMISEGSEFGQWEGTAQPCYDDFGIGSCDASYEPSWTDFTFTAPDGTKYKFDSSGKLSQRIDRNNNSLTYSSGGITHSSGKQVTFTRSSGRITEIKDPIAIATSGVAALKYSYDSNARLTNVARLVNRSGAGTYENTAYRYEDSGNANLITRVIDARGITTVSNKFDASGRLERQYDALGNYTSFAYEDNGRRQVITDRNGETMRQDFTESGQLASVQDAEAAVTTYSYDSNGRRVAELTPVGATNSFAYNERDELVGVTNELSFSSSATYNSFGLPLVVIDAMGFGTTNGYDSKGNLIATTNALGQVSRYGYDSQGNRTAETNALGLSEQTVTLFQYDGSGYLTNVTDALGNKTAYTYDANGNQLTERRERTLSSGSKQTLLTTSVYDAVNRAIAVTEPDGFTNRTAYNEIGEVAYTTNKIGILTRFQYDARGDLTNTVFALGTALETSEQNQYDAEGRRTNSVDRAGRATSYAYDGVGRLRRTVFPDGTYVQNQYDPSGRLIATMQGPKPTGMAPPPSAFTTLFEYDAAGRRTVLINALNQTNRYAYDANGNQTNFIDAINRTTGYAFDKLNRQIKTTFPDTSTESYGYDALGRRVAVTNQANIVARFGFNKVGQLTAVTNAFGTGMSNWAAYAYDEVGNQTNQVDALNRLSRFEYDAMGRRVRSAQPGGQAELFAYDAVGNMIRHTNFNGTILTNQYDALNRLTNRSSGSYQVALSYTSTGQRATMSDGSGAYSFAYNSRDQLLTNTGPAGTLVYTYDIYGRLESIKSQRSGGAFLTYQYDSLNRITNVIDATAGSTLYGFDGVGNLQSMRYPNAVTNTYTYDGLNRLTNLTAKTASATLATFAYKLAVAGNRTNLSETVNGSSRTFAWAYDPQYRLTNETNTGTSPTGTIGYRYDAVGNRTDRASTVSGVTNQTFTFNSNDWLTGDVYDSNGSTRTNGASIFFYDAETRLTNATVGGTTVTYTYNADGIRASKASGGTTTLYLVDDRNPTGYAQVLEELTVSGGTTNLAKVYTYGLDLIAQRQVSGNITHFYGYDGNGNVRYLSGSAGTVTDTYVYDAYGTLVSSSGSTPNDYRYAGEQQDSTLGHYYLRARYLNTGSGRFLSRDKFGGGNVDPPSLHRYSYAADNPVNRIDPSGNESLAGTLTVGGGYSIIGSIQLPTISVAFIRAVTAAAVISITLTGDDVAGNFVYRRLSDEQAATPFRIIGIQATDPTAIQVTPSEHIRGTDRSPWISTSRRIDVPLNIYRQNPRNPIVKIDLKKVPGPYLDFTLPPSLALLDDDYVRGLATLASEVLIFAFVPPTAIVGVVPGR
jgi:RHS repeat-associated protein